MYTFAAWGFKNSLEKEKTYALHDAVQWLSAIWRGWNIFRFVSLVQTMWKQGKNQKVFLTLLFHILKETKYYWNLIFSPDPKLDGRESPQIFLRRWTNLCLLTKVYRWLLLISIVFLLQLKHDFSLFIEKKIKKMSFVGIHCV